MTDQSKPDNATNNSTGPDVAASPEAESASSTSAPNTSIANESLDPAGTPSPESGRSSGKSAPPDSPTPRNKKPRFGWLAALLFVLVLAGIAALAYYGWQREQALLAHMDRLDNAVSDQGAQLSTIQRQAQSAASALEASAEQNRQQLDQLQEHLQLNLEEQRRQQSAQIQALHQQVRALSTTTTEDWKLAEAYYLTRLAGQRLLMERDTGSALSLLQAADEIAKNYPDPDLHDVRSALAEDMAALRLANNVDLQGIYLRIAALGQQAQTLPVGERLAFQPEGRNGADSVQTSPESEGAQNIWTTIRQSFSKALGSLHGYIRISRDDEKLDSLVTGPAVAEQLLSSLQLNLDTAQLALLREQPEIYQHSLNRAIQITARLFTDGQQRERFTTELQNLRDTDILQELPSISASQHSFASYLERRHRLAPSGNDQQETRGAQP